jgi:methyltransferase-like protein
MIGKLFDLQPKPVEKARVLELGCASGGNLLPQAIHYPEASFTGIDLSLVEIKEAERAKQALGLENVTLHCESLSKIDETWGKFDYIICHGVYSWVNKKTQEKILNICRDNLSKEGLAFVSYNALPGWNITRMLREMMFYHTRYIDDPQEKVTQAKGLLRVLSDTVAGQKSYYADLLQTECQFIENASDIYLLHDHLAEHNNPCYFYQFMDLATSHGLQYVGETQLSLMYLANMPSVFINTFQSLTNDVLRLEQYMDFATNRRFRQTLLTHKEATVNRRVGPERLASFYLSAYVVPKQPLAKVNLWDEEPLYFDLPLQQVKQVAVKIPEIKTLLYILSENPYHSYRCEELIKLVAEKLKTEIEEAKKVIMTHVMDLILRGFLNLTPEVLRPSAEQVCPCASKLVRYQVQELKQTWVTNNRHEVVPIDAFLKLVLQLIDGTRELEQLADLIMLRIEQEDFQLLCDGEPLEDKEEQRDEVNRLVEESILKARRLDLLE